MKSLKFLVILIVIASTTAMGCEKDQTVAVNKLPQVSQNFIKTHFSDLTVSRVIKDVDGVSYNWDVYFANGWEVEFKKGGEWDNIDCKMSAVPNSVLELLPKTAVTYCNTNYSGIAIVEINKESYGYDIELANDISLKFDKNGKFLRMDD